MVSFCGFLGDFSYTQCVEIYIYHARVPGSSTDNSGLVQSVDLHFGDVLSHSLLVCLSVVFRDSVLSC